MKGQEILIIDDNPLQLISVKGLLGSHGYKVFSAEESLDAVMIIARNDIKLIILDIEMPTVNGFQLMKFLIRKGIKIPVVLVSAHDGTGIQLMGEELGAVGFLSKPIEAEAFLSLVKGILD
jgi:CheY-like chemotaxis protein